MAPQLYRRGEIQGLRGVAVGLVLLFHVWPNAVPGGYVGVDVFFVISGYLITELLARTARPDERLVLVDFYARRARRLLPAATLVLTATTIGTFLLLPQSRWRETAQQIAASALYVQNWVLAWLSVDYLGVEQAPSPVQHYWSLSIEGQFYVVWPLLMIGVTELARRLKIPVRGVFVASLALVIALSLAASISITAHEQTSAYFVTHTRLWELALGGILALSIYRLEDRLVLRSVLVVLGLAAIIFSAIVFSIHTAFPGYSALLPTLGTAFVIIGGDAHLGAFRGLNVAIFRYIGDRSYSIYLWHWPLVTFYRSSHGDLGLVDGVSLIALTLLISDLTYRYVEERCRHLRLGSEVRSLLYGFGSICACAAVSGALYFSTPGRSQPTFERGDPRYPGPAALLSEVPVPPDIPSIPSLVALKEDLPIVYTNGCHQNQKKSDPIHCILGASESDIIAVVFGDSHAAQWIPALDIVASSRGWRLVTFTKSACAFARVDVLLSGKPYTSCSTWRENAIAAIKKLQPQIVFTSQSRYPSEEQVMLEGLRSVWREFISSGSQVVAIQDTPRVPFDPGDCLSKTPEKCLIAIEKAKSNSALEAAAAGIEAVQYVDMIDGICHPTICEAVVGNIIVWRDKHHLTATYASALAPYLEQRLGGIR